MQLLLKLVKFEPLHLTHWLEHRKKKIMRKDDVDLFVSKSNIEVVGPTATKICIFLVRKYCLGGTLHLASSATIPLEAVLWLELAILRKEDDVNGRCSIVIP